jgi:hypothetical protein
MKFVVSFSLFLVAVSASEAFVTTTGQGARNIASSFVVPKSQSHQQQQSGVTNQNIFFVRGGARYESTRRPTDSSSSSEVSASVVRGGGGSDAINNNIVQSLTSKPLTKAILSSTLFVFTDLIIKAIFKTRGISFPSSLAGCCFLAATLLSTPFHETLYRVLSPGAKLMQKFMMIFLVPNLIILPLCGGAYSATEVSFLY